MTLLVLQVFDVPKKSSVAWRGNKAVLREGTPNTSV